MVNIYDIAFSPIKDEYNKMNKRQRITNPVKKQIVITGKRIINEDKDIKKLVRYRVKGY